MLHNQFSSTNRVLWGDVWKRLHEWEIVKACNTWLESFIKEPRRMLNCVPSEKGFGDLNRAELNWFRLGRMSVVMTMAQTFWKMISAGCWRKTAGQGIGVVFKHRSAMGRNEMRRWQYRSRNSGSRDSGLHEKYALVLCLDKPRNTMMKIKITEAVLWKSRVHWHFNGILFWEFLLKTTTEPVSINTSMYLHVQKYYRNKHQHIYRGRMKPGSYRGVSVPEAWRLIKLNLRIYKVIFPRSHDVTKRETTFIIFYL
jgi:hypothetical protein